MKTYDHKKIEKKWQNVWEKKQPYKADAKSKKKKFYGLIEFPYPSGAGMHVGHIRSNTAMDVISRKRRMEGYNVLYPIGWDAFGLPTENYAIKTGVHPIKVTKKNTDNFRKQLKALGFSFDWSREVNTTDPKYYKWTQWIFLQFFKKGLAYKKKMDINWCPKDKIGLANEEVIDGCCERCGGVVEKREKDQWMLAITKYAERLDKDLDTVDYLEKIKIQQRNWIGKSEGVSIKCRVKDLDIEFEVYDSVPQTFMAQTFTVIAAEHPLLKKLVEGTTYEKDVLTYAKKMSEDRVKMGEEYINKIDGIFTGRYVWYEPAQRELPIWVASFAVAGYGSGMVNCSAHDERDFRFAKKYNIPLHEVAEPIFVDNPEAGLPFVERDAISAIVKHWTEDKYLVLKWKKANWFTFVTGGVEQGEDPKQSAIREIQEETGYLNFRLIRELPRSHSQFYHVPKKQNRFAHFYNFYFELENDERRDLSQEEKENHEVVWMTEKEVREKLTPEGQLRDLDIIQGKEKAIIHNGILAEPKEFKGREWNEVREDVIDFIVKKGWGKRQTNFKLRDWVFSRQRYWGEPIPLIHCEKCDWVPVPEKDLPIKLPDVKKYEPTDNGESPLAAISKWVNVKCPKCKGPARRETDTMPNWAGSSWYYLRYIDPKNNKEFASKQSLKYWAKNGVDWYNGGMEHTTLHLLYSRFWHKFLYDLKLVPTSEPYMKRTSHGLILADDGTKFSKSKGNGIDPNDVVKIYGADSLRLYEMFMGPFDQAVSWNTDGLVGPRRFLERVWKLGNKIKESKSKIDIDKNLQTLLHKTIKKVSEDIEEMRFNTAISSMMILSTEMEKANEVSVADFKIFLQLLSPFAPHITEELWQALGHKKTIHLEPWPIFDENKTLQQEVNIVVQVNGKMRGQFKAPIDINENEAVAIAQNLPEVKKWTSAGIKRVIFIPNKIVNIVAP